MRQYCTTIKAIALLVSYSKLVEDEKLTKVSVTDVNGSLRL